MSDLELIEVKLELADYIVNKKGHLEKKPHVEQWFYYRIYNEKGDHYISEFKIFNMEKDIDEALEDVIYDLKDEEHLLEFFKIFDKMRKKEYPISECKLIIPDGSKEWYGMEIKKEMKVKKR